MKVLHVLNTSKYSGAENVACQIIELLSAEKVDCVYVSYDGEIKSALAERDIVFEPVSKLSVRELKRVIKKIKPDIVHAHDMRAGVISALSCGRIPLISHIHNNNFDSRGISFKAILYYFAAKKAKHIFWVSRSSYDGYTFHKYFANKSSVLFNIINTKDIKQKANAGSASQFYDIIYLGRLTYQKNPYRLLRVLKNVVEQNHDIRIAIVGTGDMDDEVKNEARRLELTGNIDFWGFQKNPYVMLANSKVMVMTSLWEGTPMSALEAMSLGVPIVSTPTDGLIDLVQEGVTGFLSDDDNVIAKRLNEIVVDKNLRERMSRASIERADKLMDIDLYKKQILDAYSMAD